MKIENLQWIILNSIFLIVFNALFFVLGGTDRNTSVWISYGFIHFAYFMLLLTPRLTRGEKSWSALGFPLYVISSVYFLVELFIGSAFILIAFENYTGTFLVQLCIAGLYGIILFANLIANERTADAVAKRQVQISYIKDASVKVKGLLERISDKETKRKVERVYDALYSSPVRSHPDLDSVEVRIERSIHELENAVSTGNRDNIVSLADSLEAAINDRNTQLKTFN